METAGVDKVQDALLIATLSVFLARYSNAGNNTNRKYLLGKDIAISDAVDMVNDTAANYGEDFARDTFIHKDILTHALTRLKNPLDSWGIHLVADPASGDARAPRNAQNYVEGFGNIRSTHNSQLVRFPEEYTAPEAGCKEPTVRNGALFLQA
jgi:hypothetical protein